MASTAGHSERVSETTSSDSSSNSPRASMIAVPCAAIGPESRIRSPGRAGSNCARGSLRPSPVVVMYIPSAWPRSTTLVSPPTIRTPAASAARAIASTSALSVSASRPSSRIRESVRASGSAPAIARSLTVPLTASSPIEPPGKRSGLTTYASVVMARSPTSAASSSASIPKAGASRPSTRLRVARAAGAVGHRDALVAELRALGPGGLDDPQDALLPFRDGGHSRPLRAPWRSARSCSRRRRRPRRTPCRSRSAAPACTRCRRPCTRTA